VNVRESRVWAGAGVVEAVADAGFGAVDAALPEGMGTAVFLRELAGRALVRFSDEEWPVPVDGGGGGGFDTLL